MPATIRVRCNLADDPTVIQIAGELDLNEHHVVGLLVKVWSWVEDHTTGGRAPGVTTGWLDRYVGVPTFANVLEQAGWLIADDEGLIFPRWGKYTAAESGPDDDAQRPASPSTRRVRRHRARLAARDDSPAALHETRFETPQALHETPDVTLRNASTALHETRPLPEDPEPDPGSDFKSERPGSGPDSGSVFRNVTVETLRRPDLLQDWFRRATKKRHPVVRDNDRDYLFVFAAAEHALSFRTKEGQPARRPAGLFTSIVHGRKENLITQADEDAARDRVRRCPRDKPPPRSDPVASLAASLGVSSPARNADDERNRLRERFPDRRT